MKKFFKGCLCFAIMFVVLFNLTACKTPISDTGTDYSKTTYNGELTNGGMTLVYDGYLYFINGTKSNDGTSAKNNTRSAVYRVKISDDGSIDENTYERVVDNLVGYSNGSICIFGDFLYYATPNDEVNYQDSKLNYQTVFMRYDLVNKKSYVLYTTKLNSSNESIAYAYYIVGSDLNLVVYESSNATITSLKINTEVTENYIIEDVTSCVLSENYGNCVTEGASVDANNFVFYTKSPDTYEYPQQGNYTYKTSPVTNNSVCISNDKKSVSLLSIRNGKLLYSAKSISANEDVVYYDVITNSVTEKLTFTNVVSYSTYENVVFMENSDGTISSVCFDDETNEIIVFMADSNNAQDVKGTVINTITLTTSSSSSSSSTTTNLSFVGLVTLNEEIETSGDENNDSESSDGEEEVEPQTEEVTYLIYVDTNTVYKIEIMRAGEISKFNDPVKLSKSSVSAPSGYLVPETIGNYLYIFAKEVKDSKETDNIYLSRIDLTIENDSDEYATFIGVVEE